MGYLGIVRMILVHYLSTNFCCTGSSEINGAKLSDACSVRANWLCMGWPFCLAEMRREFQTGGNFFAQRCTGILSQIGTKLRDWANG